MIDRAALRRSGSSRAATIAGFALVLVVSTLGVGEHLPGWVRGVAWLVVVLVVAGTLWLRRRDRLAYEDALAAESARRAVAEDRLLIARDLHDVVSSGLGAVTVRAAVAQRLESDADGMRSALADVEGAAREATDGLRRMLAVLRGETLAPEPGVAVGAAIASAVARARAAGLAVDVSLDGAREQEPGRAGAASSGPGADAAVDVIAHVVAEALTNTARHAGPTRVRIEARIDVGTWWVRVADDGPVDGWRPRPGAGLGLVGLRERVARAGGDLTAGAVRQPSGTAGRGFVVEARGPVGSHE